MSATTTTPEGSERATSPAQCKPWCNSDQGHSVEDVPDTWCEHMQATIPLSLYPSVPSPSGVHEPRNVEIYVTQAPGQVAQLYLDMLNDGAIKLTLEEARFVARAMRDAIKAVGGR